jgi:hypothetical protein
MAEEPAGTFLDRRLRALEEVYKRSFVERGLILREVQERELWRWLADSNGFQYKCFDDWVCDAAPQSRSDCFAALRVVKELQEMPVQDLLQIKRANLEQLKKVSSSVRILPEVVAAAKSLPEKSFVAKMNAEHDQHLEAKQPVVMAPPEDMEEQETAIAIAIAVEGCTTRAEALKAIYISYIQDHAVQAEQTA